MKTFIFSFFLSFCLNAQEVKNVVCIHGFFGAPWNLRFIERNFSKKGWTVNNWGYSSRSKVIQDHGKDLVFDLKKIAEKQPGKPIHFVTHSLGGIVLRSALNHPDCPNEAKIGKVVMIGPPQ